MNTYHCMIALKDPAASPGFSVASEAWLEYLCSEDLIKSWRIMRWKLPLATGEHTDFILEVELGCADDLARTFPENSDAGTDAPLVFQRVQDLTARMLVGPSRPYPEYEMRAQVRLH